MRPSISASALAIVFLGIGLLNAAAQTAPPAPERVDFQSAARPLGPLQARKAKERGEPTTKPGDQIAGYLFRPQGSGPFPAVVLIPDCTEMTVDVTQNLPGRFVAANHLVLVVDSLGPRGLKADCMINERGDVDRVADAYGALFFLAGRPDVAKDRISVLGIGNGGTIVFAAAEDQGEEPVVNSLGRHFRAGVAYYPDCGSEPERVRFPVLVLIGRKDAPSRPGTCEDVVAHRSSSAVPLEVVVYPEAEHGFVEMAWTPAQSLLGYRVEFNKEAAEQSLAKAQEFMGH